MWRRNGTRSGIQWNERRPKSGTENKGKQRKGKGLKGWERGGIKRKEWKNL